MTPPATAGKKKNKSKRLEKKNKAKGPRMADTADRHALYGDSVQAPEAEIDFIDETFEQTRGRKAVLIREDFCGTANTATEWVLRRPENRAIGVDLDTEVIEWGRQNNIPKIPADRQNNLSLLTEDVLTVQTEPVDALLAMNFSYWLFKDRKTLRGYFEKVRDALKDDGIFFLDAYGGWEAHQEIEEERECEGFDYVWEQVRFDPISNEMDCAIHFVFPDGSEMKNAFTYSWRLWSLPEIRELLQEAGFRKVRFFWEGADEDEEADDGTFEGNGEFTEVVTAESDPGWICYIVAEK
jgi:SAM-dependent methyltransferase